MKRGIVLLLAALCGAVVAFIVYDTPVVPRAVSPPYSTPREDTAHYLTEQGEVVYAYH